MALAISFERNLLLAYKWLAENYNPGDRIFLFGFSRGAYQVRVIAGMIERIGLIYPGYSSQLPAVFKLYMSTTERSTDILELLPLRHPSHEGGHGTRMPHFGAPRRIQTNQRIHESVFTLMGIGEDVAALGIKRSKPDDEEFLLLGRIALDLFDTSSPRLASDSSQYQAWKVILMTIFVRSDGAERSIDISTQWRVSFQADGSQFATGNADGTVKIWDIKTETELRTFKGHSSPICSLTFSPDGSKIAAGSRDGTIRVWNTETGRDLFGAMEGHTGPVFGLAFSPDGTRLASGSFDSTVRLWDEAGKSRLLEGHRGPVWSVAFSKDYIISGSDDKTIRVWDAGSGGLVRVLRGHAGTVFCVAFSPDFKLVASGSDDWTARLWDVSSGEVLAIYDVGDV
ncbi:hypothetical protein AB1N83_013857, partial [Pleurotus pulmonarius]